MMMMTITFKDQAHHIPNIMSECQQTQNWNGSTTEISLIYYIIQHERAKPVLQDKQRFIQVYRTNGIWSVDQMTCTFLCRHMPQCVTHSLKLSVYAQSCPSSLSYRAACCEPTQPSISPLIAEWVLEYTQILKSTACIFSPFSFFFTALLRNS